MARGREHARLVRAAVDGGERADGVRLRAGLVEDGADEVEQPRLQPAPTTRPLNAAPR
jgi:hypothetical protein